MKSIRALKIGQYILEDPEVRCEVCGDPVLTVDEVERLINLPCLSYFDCCRCPLTGKALEIWNDWVKEDVLEDRLEYDLDDIFESGQWPRGYNLDEDDAVRLYNHLGEWKSFPYQFPTDKFIDMIKDGYPYSEALEYTRSAWRSIFFRELTEEEIEAINLEHSDYMYKCQGGE